MTKLSQPVEGLPLASEELQLQVREVVKGLALANLRIISIQKMCNNLTGWERAQLAHASELSRVVEGMMNDFNVPF